MGAANASIHVRLRGTAHDLIAREAAYAGVSVAQYLREAGLVRAVMESVQRDPVDPGLRAEVYEMAARLLEEEAP